MWFTQLAMPPIESTLQTVHNLKHVNPIFELTPFLFSGMPFPMLTIVLLESSQFVTLLFKALAEVIYLV